jgi:hypothetical protein
VIAKGRKMLLMGQRICNLEIISKSPNFKQICYNTFEMHFADHYNFCSRHFPVVECLATYAQKAALKGTEVNEFHTWQ